VTQNYVRQPFPALSYDAKNARSNSKAWHITPRITFTQH